jgi:flavodoxin
MTRTLVVYHSRSGYTRRIAQALAARLGADLDEIRIVQPLDGWPGYVMCALEAITGLAPALRPMRRDPSHYGCVVIGTPVWFWSVSSPVRAWFERHRLRGRRFAFFCTMGGSGHERAFAGMEALAGAPPIATLALTDVEVDVGANARLDAFVQALGSRRRTMPATARGDGRATRPAVA